MSERNFETYWEDIGGKVLTELERRLSEGSSAADLPGTLLMRLAEKYITYMEKLARQEEADIPYMTAMDAIDQEGLPIENKIQILQDYISKLESDHTIAINRLAELEREKHGLPPLHES